MALLVDATGEYLSRSTGGFYSTATYTVCLWAILDSSRASVSAAIWGLYGPVTNDVYCPILYNQNDDGTTMIWQQNVTGTNTIDLAAGVMTVGTWYFLAHTRSGTGTNSANAYTAAATDTSFTTTTATFSLAAMTPILEVAYTNNFGLTTGWINGRIAGLKQWDAVLTPEELWAERSQLAPVRVQNLVSWYPMLGAATASAADFSGNGRNFTVTGSPTVADGPPVPWMLRTPTFTTRVITARLLPAMMQHAA